MHPLSDVDIAISSREELDLIDLGGMIADLETVLEKSVDLVLLDDLPRRNPKLAFSIVDRHEVLLMRNEEKYFTFKEEAYRHYFDFAPMLHLFEEAFYQRVVHGIDR